MIHSDSSTSLSFNPSDIQGPALNGMGYVFFTSSPVGEAFLKQECIVGKRVLDIGPGYSHIPGEALKSGVTEYTANEISPLHLKMLQQKIHIHIPFYDTNRLILIEGKAPESLPQKEGYFDAVLADKVIHYFTPQEILKLIAWAKISLKKGGKLYVTTSSPHAPLYLGIAENFLRKKAAGDPFPGLFTGMMGHLNAEYVKTYYERFEVPDQMTLFDSHTLTALFEREGMRVLERCAMQIPRNEGDPWVLCDEENANMVGVIVENI